MGGFTVAFDWTEPPDEHRFARMTQTLLPRGPAGVRIHHGANHRVAEVRTHRDGSEGWEIATHGPLILVGDIRLWNRDELIDLDGAGPANDRTLILSAFAAHGAGISHALDGDFAFAIVDTEQRQVHAFRDHFGVKPLFFARTGTGLLVGSSVPTIVNGMEELADPDPYAIQEFLSGRSRYADRTFIDGVRRLMPAYRLTAGAAPTPPARYWSLTPGERFEGTRSEAAQAFRTHLTEAVERRITGHTVVSHLSGGLDSSSIAACAADLPDVDLECFTTVSGVFGDLAADESRIIAQIVARQPFAHRTFAPRAGSLDDFVDDMAITGTPVAHPVRDLTVRTREIAADTGADLVLTGNGGDDVAGDGRILEAMLASRWIATWATSIGSLARHSPRSAARAAVVSGGRALPDWAKAPLRRLRPQPPTSIELLTATTDRPADPIHILAEDLETQISSGRMQMLLEQQDAMFAAAGLEVSHPYLDKQLVEFVASIPVERRPLGPHPKAFLREGFADSLPKAVIDRPHKATGDSVVRDVIDQRGPEFLDRFPSTPIEAYGVIPPGAYDRLLSETIGDNIRTTMALWNLWSVMLWLTTRRKAVE